MDAEPVGVAQLRQNLSAYLRRIEQGERFVVTDRNREVAQLAPIPRNVREELIADGRLLPGHGDWRDIEAVRLSGERNGLSRELDALRRDE